MARIGNMVSDEAKMMGKGRQFGLYSRRAPNRVCLDLCMIRQFIGRA